MGTWGRDESGYIWISEPSLNLGSSGPTRVVTDEPTVPAVRPPLGFVTREEFELWEPEPLLWDGD